MGVCPFCHGEISAELERFGGTCPHCFAHIPGEDAATDPGEEVKAQLRTEDDRRKRLRALTPVFVAVPLTLAVLVGVYLNIRPEPHAEPLEFGAEDMAFEIEIAALDTDELYREKQEQLAKAEAAEKAAASAKTTRRQNAAVIPSAGSGSDEAGSADVAPKAAPVDDLGLFVGARRKGPVLSDRADIKAAFQDAFRRSAGRLEICLKKANAGEGSVSGSWKFSVVVDKEGAFTEVEVSGADMQDAAFEECLKKEVSSWRLSGRLEKPWPVSFPINFSS